MSGMAQLPRAPNGTLNGTFKISPRILDHLGISAYNSLRKCLAELAANAHDADATEVRIGLPDTLDQNATIELEDNGVGMSAAELDEDYLFIGRDRRKDSGERTAKNRLVVGSKGIGKLAGFGVASRIEVTTRKAGAQSQVVLDRNTFNDLTALSSHTIPIISSPTERSSGTCIRLSSLNSNLDLPDTTILRRQLFKTLPQIADFRVYVNGVECTAEDVPGERHAIAEEVQAIGQVSGFYVITNTRQPKPGLSVRVRGRIVAEPSLFGLDTRSHGICLQRKRF